MKLPWSERLLDLQSWEFCVQVPLNIVAKTLFWFLHETSDDLIWQLDAQGYFSSAKMFPCYCHVCLFKVMKDFILPWPSGLCWMPVLFSKAQAQAVSKHITKREWNVEKPLAPLLTTTAVSLTNGILLQTGGMSKSEENVGLQRLCLKARVWALLRTQVPRYCMPRTQPHDFAMTNWSLRGN